MNTMLKTVLTIGGATLAATAVVYIIGKVLNCSLSSHDKDDDVEYVDVCVDALNNQMQNIDID